MPTNHSPTPPPISEKLPPNMLYDQTCLSEQLQLLDTLGYSHPRDVEFTRMPSINAEIQALDTIAVALTTGAPGEVFATAFDKRQGFMLVLAKNTRVTAEDEQAVRELVDAITASNTEDANDVLPVLLSRCRKNIEKRIAKMHEAVETFSQVLEAVLRNYKPSLFVEAEFPSSDRYRKGRYAGHDPSFPHIMHNLLADIMARAQAINSGDANLTIELYVELATISLILLYSRLLRWLCDPANRVHRPWKSQAEKLNRRLIKACRYFQGINNLIRYAKHYFPHGIHHRWVDTAGTEQTTFLLDDDYLGAISRALDSPLPDGTVAALHDRFPDMKERWRSSHFLKTRLHPEICIVLHLSTPYKCSDRGYWRPIGCNKRCCLCCTAWMRTYSLLLGPRWLMSRIDGKADATWALPGCSYAHAIVRDGKSSIDESARRAVSEYLIDHLYSLFPVLSGPESDWKPGEAQALLDAMVKNYDHFIKDVIDNRKRPGIMTRAMKWFRRIINNYLESFRYSGL